MAHPPKKQFPPKKSGPRPPSKGMAAKIAADKKPIPEVVDDGGDIGMPARIAALNLVDASLAKRSGFDEAVTRAANDGRSPAPTLAAP